MMTKLLSLSLLLLCAGACRVVEVPRTSHCFVSQFDAAVDLAVGSDAHIDAGLVVDARPIPVVDAGPVPVVDAGTTLDSCATDNPLTTLDCNGGVVTAASSNAPGGTCAMTTTARGSCFNADAVCDSLCLLPCTPGGTYVSTGGCASGSRCFNLGGGEAFCYPICRDDGDCAVGECDPNGACIGA